MDKVDGKWTIREDPVRVVDLLAEIRQLKGQNEANEEEMKMSGQNIGSVMVTKLQELLVEGGFEKNDRLWFRWCRCHVKRQCISRCGAEEGE